jgi:predicted transcriptional regulator
MPISDLCSKNVVCVERNASLQYAAQLMKNHHVGGIVVVESSGKHKPIGILTDRDIVLHVVAESRSLSTRVEEIMSKGVIQVKKDDGIASVVERMEREGVRRLVVVDDSGNACGVVSSDDVLQLVAKEMNGLGRLVERQLQNEKTYQFQQNDWML